MKENKFYEIANRICEIEKNVGFGHNRYDGAMSRVEIWNKEIDTSWEEVVGEGFPEEKKEWYGLMSVWVKEIEAVEKRLSEIEENVGVVTSEFNPFRRSIADGDMSWEDMVGFNFPNEKEEWSSLMSQWLCFEQMWLSEYQEPVKRQPVSEYNKLEKMKLEAQRLAKILYSYQKLRYQRLKITHGNPISYENFSSKYIYPSDCQRRFEIRGNLAV